MESDHPRSRGVYIIPPISQLAQMGSSPLARGLLMSVLLVTVLCRIIPARAGFTPAGWTVMPSRADHPRSRGVYGCLTLCGISRLGSSPLARGLRSHVVARTVRWGIIPARAGFTSRTPARAVAAEDHPRSRGVYLRLDFQSRSHVGSSPLARGLPSHCSAVAAGSGIIPARAGFTGGGAPRTGRPSDHPRSRGVYPIAS